MQHVSFIGGFGRSGTTLLADIMGFHPEVSPIYETDFLLSILGVVSSATSLFERQRRVRALMEHWTRDLPRRPDSKAAHERFAHGPHHLLFTREYVLQQTELLVEHLDAPVAPLRRFIANVFAEHCRAAGKPFWVNKTPGYLQFIRPLHAVFPNLRFLHIVRDGRDVAASVVTRPWGPSAVEDVAKQWAQSLDDARTFMAEHPDQVHVLHYEALLHEPEATLRAAFGFLGHEMPTDLVDRYVERMGPFDTDRIGAHRESFTERDHARFLERAGDTLEAYGYPVEQALA